MRLLERQHDPHTYRLANLSCADCAAKFEEKVKQSSGVVDAKVNFGASKLTVVGRPLSIEEVEKLGAFDNIKVAVEEERETAFWKKSREVGLIVFSLLLMIAAFWCHMLGTSAALYISLYVAATALGGWETFKKGVPSLLRLDFNMNTLMAVAVGGALAIGYWAEAAVVAFLFGVSEALEAFSMERARRSIRSLMEMAPRRASIRRNGVEQITNVEDVRVGDTMIVRPGEKIAMDGKVVNGQTAVNEAPITGESVPVDKEPGDEVFAGSLNTSGAIEVEVTKLTEDTTLSKIITLVEEAQEQRAPSQKFVDRFAKVYTPAVMALAVGIGLFPPLLFGAPWQPWVYNALALLIVACPCALVVSTPVAIVSALGNAARNGVLIKGGIHLENVGGLRGIAFDKTGTLTEGRPAVSDVVPLKGRGEDDVLTLAASIEQLSEHPLAEAVVRAARERNLPLKEAKDFEAIPGKGAQARVGGTVYRIGNRRLFEGELFKTAAAEDQIQKLRQEGKTVMVLGDGHELIAVIAVSDRIRETSRNTLRELKRIGVDKTVMLTGDDRLTAQAFARDVGVDDVRSELLPQEKVAAIQELKKRYDRIAMVGDGINDAPALAAATSGIAMGGAGSDTALETADIVLMADDLSKLPFTIRLSRSALRVIKQNITLSLVIKAVATAMVFPGWLTLWLAILADMGATLLVTANGMRLLRIQPEKREGVH